MRLDQLNIDSLLEIQINLILIFATREIRNNFRGCWLCLHTEALFSSLLDCHAILGRFILL